MSRALDILAGCPNGATEAALALHGITRDRLDRLVRIGLVRHVTETLTMPKAMRIDRFHITDTGRFILEQMP